MLANRNEANPVDDVQIQQDFQNHLAAVKAWLARQANMEVLYVNFNALLDNPQMFCSGIGEFIGIPLNVDRMLSVPNKNLYRNRGLPNRVNGNGPQAEFKEK